MLFILLQLLNQGQGIEELDAPPRFQHGLGQPKRQVSFPNPGRAEKQAIGGVIEPAIVIRQLHQRGGIEAGAVLKLKVGQTFYGG